MEDRDKLERIMRRVRAALELASEGSGATPDEAAVAAATAQRLMLAYNLELSQVMAETGAKSTYVNEPIAFDKKAGGYLAPLRMLCTVIARANFCDVIVTIRKPTGYIVGEPHNVAAVKEMYARLAAQVLNMANAAWAREPRAERAWRAAGFYGIPLARKSMSWKRTYMFGVAVTINARLAMEQERAKAEAAQGEQVRALIVLKEREIEQAVEQYHGAIESHKSASKYRGQDAFDAGKRDGYAVELGRREKLAAGAPALEAGEGE